MALMQDAPITAEQILKKLGEVARANEDKTFRVRVMRKTRDQMIPSAIATLDGATLEHIASPEVWLPQLAGGGIYHLIVTHRSAPTEPFQPLQVQIAQEPKAVDPNADNHPLWEGPARIVMPSKRTNDEQHNEVLLVGPTGATGTPPRNGVPQGSAPVGPAHSSSDPLAPEKWRLEREREELQRRDRVAQEERHARELELVRKSQELEVAKLRAEFGRKPEGESEMSKFLLLMREEAKQREEREERRRSEEREREEKRLAAEREREDRRREEERLREERRLEREREDRKERAAERARLEERMAAERKLAEERFMQMMQDRATAQKQMMEMMAPVTEMMGTSMNLVVQSMHALQELAPRDEGEPPIFKLVGKVVDGIQAAAEAARNDRRVMPPGYGRPPSRPPPSRRPPPPRVEVQPPAPPPPPAPTPASASAAQPMTTPGFAGVEAPPAPPKRPAMEVLVEMVKAKRDPEEVARFFYANLAEPSIAKELEANDMKLVPTFTPHFIEWLQESEANQQYMRGVFAKVHELGEKMGIAEPVEDEEEEEDEDEDEADEVEGEEEPE